MFSPLSSLFCPSLKTDTENYDYIFAFIIFYHNRSGAVNKEKNFMTVEEG